MLSLAGTSVAGSMRWLLGALAEAGVETDFWPTPVEIPGDVEALDQDARDAYDPDVMRAVHGAFLQAGRVLGLFRARFVGKCSPAHLFWGAFDLAVTRFSGEWVLPYDAVRQSGDPDAALTTFLETAAAGCAGWDRGRLERGA